MVQIVGSGNVKIVGHARDFVIQQTLRPHAHPHYDFVLELQRFRRFMVNAKNNNLFVGHCQIDQFKQFRRFYPHNVVHHVWSGERFVKDYGIRHVATIVQTARVIIECAQYGVRFALMAHVVQTPSWNPIAF